MTKNFRTNLQAAVQISFYKMTAVALPAQYERIQLICGLLSYEVKSKNLFFRQIIVKNRKNKDTFRLHLGHEKLLPQHL